MRLEFTSFHVLLRSGALGRWSRLNEAESVGLWSKGLLEDDGSALQSSHTKPCTDRIKMPQRPTAWPHWMAACSCASWAFRTMPRISLSYINYLPSLWYSVVVMRDRLSPRVNGHGERPLHAATEDGRHVWGLCLQEGTGPPFVLLHLASLWVILHCYLRFDFFFFDNLGNSYLLPSTAWPISFTLVLGINNTESPPPPHLSLWTLCISHLLAELLLLIRIDGMSPFDWPFQSEDSWT